MTPKYFVEQIKRLVTRITNLEARVPAGKIKVKFNPTDTIAAGAYVVKSVTVPGSVLGDAIVIGYEMDSAESITVNGAMDNTGSVNVLIRNNHGSNALTLAGDWYVHVIK